MRTNQRLLVAKTIEPEVTQKVEEKKFTIQLLEEEFLMNLYKLDLKTVRSREIRGQKS